MHEMEGPFCASGASASSPGRRRAVIFLVLPGVLIVLSCRLFLTRDGSAG
jgi:hypothetical protein